ncbi:MAG TPA: RCC1 domain-containing protein, partial [Bacillota bacterium]|nr:RCC1 domain-containing protein [Bacillota bacterium]
MNARSVILKNFSRIVGKAGLLISLALLSANTARAQNVIAWGDNSRGQATVPASATNVIAVAGGGYHSLALQADGSVLAWGYNNYGQTTIPK